MTRMNHTAIAAKLGYTPNYVRDKLTKMVRYGIRFPRPVFELNQKKREWDESDIDAYAEAIRKKLQR